jgi:hypothetical protein
VSTRTQTQLSKYCSELFSCDPLLAVGNGEIPKIKLHEIMGCQNWAMIIDDIAALQSSSSQEPIAESENQQLIEKGQQIRCKLVYQTSGLRASLDCLRKLFGGPLLHYASEVFNQHTVYIATYTFACVTLIYIDIIISRIRASEFFESDLRPIIAALQMLPDPRMIRGLIWPLCVAGCMASTPSDQQFFRELAQNGVKDAGAFGKCGETLKILEGS